MSSLTDDMRTSSERVRDEEALTAGPMADALVAALADDFLEPGGC